MSNVSKDCGKKNSSVLIAKHFKETLNGFFWKSESDNFLREEYSIDVLGLQKIRSTMFSHGKGSHRRESRQQTGSLSFAFLFD